MTENSKKQQWPRYPNIRVKLVGKDSNAYYILGLCQRAAIKAELPQEEIKLFLEEATSGDYNVLLSTCQRWFDCY